MKISLNWLKDYVDLPKEATPEEIAKRLTFAGFEVEALTNRAKGLEKVFVGEILERKPHPNADRLSLTTINVGTALTSTADKLEIVCGAQNIKVGQRIPVATLGAVIPNGLEIKAAKIRGVASSGMLCSLDELLFPKEWQAEDGIFLLEASAEIGTPLAKHLGLDDWIFEINVTPNRGDALSHIGMAREVAALFGAAARFPEVKEEKNLTTPKYEVAVVNTAGSDLCPTYYARLVEGVKVGPSPKWLRDKIEAIGLRSISNVVDITSFVMFEMGQPLHAFDADTLLSEGKKIQVTVRTAADKESFVSLSDKTLSLLPQDIVIASGPKGEKAVALAGVMGGKNSEVSGATVNVLLEAAEFHPVSVRKTGRRLGLLTDAGYRFERGVDSGRVEWAMNRATELLVTLAGGKPSAPVVAKDSHAQSSPSIRLRHSDIARLLGKVPEQGRVLTILRALGFGAEVGAGEPDVLNVRVPLWRKDVKRAVDLIEEVARIWGFDQLEAKLPLGGIGQEESKQSKRHPYFQIRRIRRHLSSLGFYEALNHGFTSPDALSKLLSASESQDLVEIANPVTTDYSVLKPTLLTGLLENIAHNFAHQAKNLRFFEVRRTFTKSKNTELEARLNTGVDEVMRLSLAVTGDEVDEFWEGKASAIDFYSLKGTLESIFELLGVQGLQYRAETDRSYLHPGQSASIVQGNRVIGVLGRLHPKVEKNFGFEQGIYVAELDLEALLTNSQRAMSFKPFSNFPVVERDFSVLVKDEVNSQMIRALVTKLAKPLLKEFHYFDVYKGSRVPAGHVSYAFRIQLGADDHTLTDQEIHSVQEKIMQNLEKEFSARFAGLN